MQILDKYIGKAVVSGVLSVLLVMVALDTLIGFASESSQIGREGYTFWYALGYVLLRTPQQMYELFPMIALLGTMLGLGGLANSSELIIIRAAGVSTWQLVASIMKTALLLMLLAMFIGEVVAPPAIQYAKLKRVKALAAEITLNTDYGLWARDGHTYINVRRVETDGRLTGITLYSFDDLNELKGITRAAKATHDGDNWVLSGVTETTLAKDGIKVKRQRKLTWTTLLNPNIVKVVSVAPENLAIWNLGSYINYLRDNGLDTSRYQLSFWSKIFMPITIGAMVMIAIPFILGSLRYTGIGQRIFIGFLGGLVFYLINRLSGQVGIVYGLPAMLSAGLPTLLVLSGSAYLLHRLR